MKYRITDRGNLLRRGSEQRNIWCVLTSALIFSLTIGTGYGSGSGVWKLDALNGDWSTPENWSCAAGDCVPNGGFDTATFNTSNITDISLSEPITILSLTFNVGASGYSITCPPGEFFTIIDGITDNSAAIQSFRATVDEAGNSGGFQLQGGSAGSSTSFTNEARTTAEGSSGNVQFIIDASAGSAIFLNKGGVVPGAGGGETVFYDRSTAATATITNEGGW